MELPIWRSTKQDPLIRSARHDVEATQSEYKAIELKLRAKVNIGSVPTRFSGSTLPRFHHSVRRSRYMRPAILLDGSGFRCNHRRLSALARGSGRPVASRSRSVNDLGGIPASQNPR
jgi:hypothetical protein